jgi:hypothetical protein
MTVVLRRPLHPYVQTIPETTLMHRKTLTLLAASAIAATTAATAIASPGDGGGLTPDQRAQVRNAPVTRLDLTPSSPDLARCMPNARVKVTVRSTTDAIGFDILHVRARHLAPNRDFTVFLLETAGAPFGAAEYVGDITTDARGNADNDLHLIVDEAFSSTIVNGQRVRVDLNQVGMWFADPADDDFCLGANSPVTPFDGDNEAGVQAFNSANTQPLPAP